MSNSKILLDLFLTFMKIGGFTLGGGFAMIPVIQQITVDKKKWATEEEFTDFIALAQSVPGVVGVNTATTVGNKVLGVKGAVVATLGMITPSLIVIIIIAMLFKQFQETPMIQSAFKGVRAVVVALILMAVVRLSKTAVKDKFQIFIFLLATVLALFFNIYAPYIIILCGTVSLIYKITFGKESGA